VNAKALVQNSAPDTTFDTSSCTEHCRATVPTMHALRRHSLVDGASIVQGLGAPPVGLSGALTQQRLQSEVPAVHLLDKW